MRRRPATPGRLHSALILCMSLFFCGRADSISVLEYEAAQLTFPGGAVAGLSAVLSLETGALRVRADTVVLPDVADPIRALSLDCKGAELTPRHLICESGRVTFDHPWIGARDSEVTLVWNRADDSFQIDAKGIEVLGGAGSIRASGSAEAWSLDLALEGLEVPHALSAANWALDVAKALDGNGHLGFRARLWGSGSHVGGGTGSIQFRGVDLENDDGTLGIEGLQGVVKGQWNNEQGHMQFSAETELIRGELFRDPIYLSVVESAPVSVSVRGTRNRGSIRIERFDLEHAPTGIMGGALEIELPNGPIRGAELAFDRLRLAGIYQSFLGSMFDPEERLGFDVEGDAAGRIRLTAGRLSEVSLQFADLDVSSSVQQLGITGGAGDLEWNAAGTPARSTVRWQQANIYRLPVGPGEIAVEAQGERFRSLSPTTVPILGGKLIVDSFAAEHDEQIGVSWRAGGRATGISLERLTDALDWVSMSGDVSGILPMARYQANELIVDGALLIRAFDGTVTATGLRLKRPLGPGPTLEANIDLRGLDLRALTQTFSFGKIEGQVDGWIRGLRLVDWRPRAFDAYIGTPVGYSGRRRISQEAVEELASIGGGGAGAQLSKGFLGLFNEFAYRRLGIGCVLDGGTCTMRGVSPATHGYHLVEGGGLPRIDVIGFTDRVNWEELVARLIAATRSGAPIIQKEVR